MSKINIPFNGTDYSVDEVALEVAANQLKSHLSSVMNGSGATIKLGGVSYNIDSAKLSTATNAFISHLGTISGSGAKVKVNGVEYNVDSAKLGGAVSELKTVLGNLVGGSDVGTPAGLYANGVMTKSWDELVSEGALRVENGVLIGNGDEDFNNTSAQFLVGDLIVPNNVTSIAELSFCNCSSLTAVHAPNVTSIGDHAFIFCNTLATIDFPNVTSIGKYAFAGCALASVDFSNVVNIGEAAFGNCKNLKTLILRSETMCSIDVSALFDTGIVTLEGTPAGEGFIYVPTSLYEGYIVDLTSKIMAFAAANGASMDEPTATYVATAIIRKIEDDAEGGDEPKPTYSAGLYKNGVMTKSWNELISEGIIKVENGCVTSVDKSINGDLIGSDYITSIGRSAFYECKSLTTVNFSNATSIDADAFYDCESLTTANFPKATSIGAAAFNGCESLAVVNFPLATSIDHSAFFRCESLTTVNFPNVTNIGTDAFGDCYALTTADFPLVTSINYFAFADCPSLTALILRSPTMCDIDIGAIVGNGIITIEGMPTGTGFVYVPTSLYESYVADLVPKAIVFATEAGLPMDEATATYIISMILRKIEDYSI